MGKRHFKVLLPETSFLLFLVRFWGADLKWTSPSAGFHFFALDTPIMSSVRPKIVENWSAHRPSVARLLTVC